MFENRIPLKTAQRFRAMPYYADIRPMTEVGIFNLSRYAKRLRYEGFRSPEHCSFLRNNA